MSGDPEWTADPESDSWVEDLRALEREGVTRSGRPSVRDESLNTTAGTGRNSSTTGPDTASGTPTRTGQSTDRSAGSPLLTKIRREAAIDGLTVIDSVDRRRDGHVVDVRASVDGRRYDLDLRLYRRPDSTGFDADLAAQFDRWADVGDLTGIVPVVDAAKRPRPWVCTAPVGESLLTHDPGHFADALQEARSLARTLTNLHERGIVHAGIDPIHVVYPAEGVDGRGRPLLDNVGLVDVFRRYTDPATIYDPRYAPPEYFDDRYGVVDRMTDVYALGTVLYRLFTGRHPYNGSPTAVREAVLTDPVPRPSSVADVPDAVDDVIRRATATDKFDRFQSAATFEAALADLSSRQ